MPFTKRFVGLLAALSLLALPSIASAHTSIPIRISCGAADFSVSGEPTPWAYRVIEDGSTVLAEGETVAKVTQTLSVGFRLTDNGSHTVTALVYNNNPAHDGQSQQSAIIANCGPTPKGETGPKGEPGLSGYGGAVSTQAQGQSASATSSSSSVANAAPVAVTVNVTAPSASQSASSGIGKAYAVKHKAKVKRKHHRRPRRHCHKRPVRRVIRCRCGRAR